MKAHLVRDEGVAGSNPATPTSPHPLALIFHKHQQLLAIWSGPEYTRAYTIARYG
jgi:hypothetical protein